MLSDETHLVFKMLISAKMPLLWESMVVPHVEVLGPFRAQGRPCWPLGFPSLFAGPFVQVTFGIYQRMKTMTTTKTTTTAESERRE